MLIFIFRLIFINENILTVKWRRYDQFDWVWVDIKLALLLLSAYSPRIIVKRNYKRVKTIYEKNAFPRTWFIKKTQKLSSVVWICVPFGQETLCPRCCTTDNPFLVKCKWATQSPLAQLKGEITPSTSRSGHFPVRWSSHTLLTDHSQTETRVELSAIINSFNLY